MVTIQCICDALKDITINLAHWMFALKYLGSALTLPALFGGEPTSETTHQWLARADKIMSAVFIAVPSLGYTGIWVLKAFSESATYKGFLETAFVLFISVMGLSQLATAVILLFAILSIRHTLKKNNKLKTFNLNMFMVNAFAFLLQIASLLIWYWQWYVF